MLQNFSFLQTDQYCIICVGHHFFIHLSTDGYLGCFHILAIVTSAAKNIKVLLTLPDLDFKFLDKYAEVRLLYNVVVLFLMFWRNCVLLFVAATPFFILINGSIVDPWTPWGLVSTLIENLPVTLQFAFLSVVHIHGFNQPQIMYYCSRYLLRKKIMY